jgi:Protein of unknown function (DUF669)
MTDFYFNPQEHRPSDGTRKLLSEGDYVGAIESVDVKPNSKGNGSYLQIEIAILSGEFQGETVRDMFNLDNPNPRAVKIAQESLTALCYAMGRINPLGKAEDLLNQPFNFRIKVEPASKAPDGKDYPAKNLVARYIFDKNILKGGSPKTAVAGAASAAPVSIKDDDVPF